MDSLRGLLLLLTLLAVTSSEDSEVTLQREADLPTEILDALKAGSLVSLPVKEKGPWIEPDSMELSVSFPPARPTMENILAICNNGNQRPRYTKDMLPQSGFGYLHRQANAVNQLESWFSVCCSNSSQDENMTLCCAQQAWEASLSHFCEEELGIKTNPYHCCKKAKERRWNCFEEEAPDPLYQRSATIEDFDFDPSSCQKTSVSEIMPKSTMMFEPSADRWMEQRIVIPKTPMYLGDEAPGLSSHHVFSPRSMKPSINFPLARPSTSNIHAICRFSNQRPRHSDDRLPKIGLSYLQSSAVNQLESWYTVCCNGTKDDDDELTLCCAQQMWEKSLSDFCEKQFRIKTNHYHCCRKNGLARWNCFEKKGKSYEPSGPTMWTRRRFRVPGFDFDPNSCQNKSTTEMSFTPVDISFPPGRPNSVNIEPICAFREHRPRYLISCLPQTGFEWFAHQLKAINNLEKSYARCCKDNKNIQACAEEKWKKMVDTFCKNEKSNQENQYECCKKQKGEQQYNCFSTTAKNPDYMVLQELFHFIDHPHLDRFCGTYNTLQKMKRLPFDVDNMADKCCILVEDERSTCLQKQLDNLLDEACKVGEPSGTHVTQNCCKKAAKGHSNCLTKLLLQKISKAIKINRKKCPII